MTARIAAALAAVLAATPGRGDDPPPPVNEAAGPASPSARLTGSLLVEGTFLAAYTDRAALEAGGRVTVRVGGLTLVASREVQVGSTVQPRFDTLLFGAGLVHELSTRFALHGTLVVGTSDVLVRNYVDGGWRRMREYAGGVRLGARRRLAIWNLSRPPHTSLAPFLGVSATVLYVGQGSDRLRGIEWGGFTPALSLTLGAELGPQRRAAP